MKATSQLEFGLDAAPPSPVFAPVPAPALWGPDGQILLPERVRLISLWQPFAGLVIGDGGAPGRKSLETRTWPWPYEPSWLCIYATVTPKVSAYRRIFGADWKMALHRDDKNDTFGRVLGLVWIAGCRKMRPGDEAAACYPVELDRYVWVIGASHRLHRPIPLARGPQKFASLSREDVAAALR